MSRSVKRLEEFFSFLEDDLVAASVSDDLEFCPDEFDDCLPEHVETAARHAAVARQRKRAQKRADLGDKTLAPQAISDFVNLNGRMGEAIVTVPRDIADNARAFITYALERYSTSVNDLNIQVTLDRNHLHDLWRFGPGASYGTKGTHAVDKMSQPWTTTLSAAPVVMRTRQFHPYLRAKDGMQQEVGIVYVRGSRLQTVPKNKEKERTIAIEPLGNMCLQLAAGEYLKQSLKGIGLDIGKQQLKNNDLAKRGSLMGHLATLDLKSASDMIHPSLVRLLLPPEWYELLMAIRSPETELPNGEWVTLHMISTMGNGFTFPLMTLIIVALIYGFRCQEPGSPTLWIDWSNTGVYGDDIVLPAHEARDFCYILEDSGLVVNHDKSYFDGPFRESCGGDYYRGVLVTPFYVESLVNDAEIYVALNKTAEWAGRVGVHLNRSLAFLFKALSRVPYFVPEWEQPTSGFRCTQVSRRYKKLIPVLKSVLLEDKFFLLPLACGGYVSGDLAGGVNVTPWVLTVNRDGIITLPPPRPEVEPSFTPRPVRVRYRAVKSRLPKCYLDGRDYVSRSPVVSAHCDFVAWAAGIAP